MATLVLSAAGQAIGGAFGGALGAVLGQAAGAVAGTLIDQSLFGGGGGRTVEGGRLADLDVQSSTEGAAIPFVYGRVRLSGQVIWATRFEEVVSEERQGGKGGRSRQTTVRSYRYFGNFAVALCQGPIHHIGRVWADGKLLDLSQVMMRVYHGTADQLPDPLIAAKQRSTPAYRNVAYVVFERLALEAFGDRMPQLSFEVIRAADRLEPMVKAVTLIPGAGEFVYEPAAVTRTVRPGVTETENRHVLHADSNFHASLDELLALCPNLESVALVVGWFGDDLNAGNCTIRPKTEGKTRVTNGVPWSVNGVSRAAAEVVSLVDGRPAYGGTPSDASVVAAIKELKARGLRVVLYPFLLMDIPAGNGLADPYGGAEQAAFPWRGRITGADGSPTAAGEIAGFSGTAEPQHFLPQAASVAYAGPAEWSYRRFILHHARLAQVAGGVDAFLIGSEMRGLTRLRDDAGNYPFVAALQDLAGDVRQIIGGSTKISYAADWSEYGGHQPEAGELRFPLDPLWANADIDMVAIDNYLPIADQRDAGDPDGNADPYDLVGLRAHLAGGEYFDWFYATGADRKAGLRTPIGDGAYGKPFVFRAKDIAGWWRNLHIERVGGVELASPTAWQAEMKPIWFTELGFPAIDKGTNQPNVFPDPKSSEAALPYFSTGSRDDLLQRRALEASLSWWGSDHPDLPQGENPISSVYGGPMVDPGNIHLWAFDARPFPEFPAMGDIWSDGVNWRGGHWLNGRLGGLSLEGLLRAVASDLGVPDALLRYDGLAGALEGLTIAGPVSFRDVAERLLDAFGMVAADRGSDIALLPAWREAAIPLGEDDLAEVAVDQPLISRHRGQASDLPAEIRFAGRDAFRDHRRHVIASRRLEGGARRVGEVDLGAVIGAEALGIAAERALVRQWTEREEIGFALSPHRLDLEPGDILQLGPSEAFGLSQAIRLRIEAIEEGVSRSGEVRLVTARSTARPPVITREERDLGGQRRAVIATSGPAEAMLLDLPALPGSSDPQAPRLAVFASPWPGAFSVLRGDTDGTLSPVGQVENPATMGTLATSLAPGPVARWDNVNAFEVELYGGVLSSRTELEVLGGANSAAIMGADGTLEIVQFRQADLVGERRYRLSGLLRGQLGTEDAAAKTVAEGSRFVLIDDALATVPLAPDRLTLDYVYRLVPEGRTLDDLSAVTLNHAASGRGLMPLAPVHLRARRDADGSVVFSWVRRTRDNGDSWVGIDVPLGEEVEAYELDLLHEGGAVAATLLVSEPEVVLAAADEVSIFGGLQTEFHLRCHQLSRLVGRGIGAEAVISI